MCGRGVGVYRMGVHDIDMRSRAIHCVSMHGVDVPVMCKKLNFCSCKKTKTSFLCPLRKKKLICSDYISLNCSLQVKRWH
jgi:hypothetical protein